MPLNDFSVPTPDDRMTITCLYCGKPQEVGRRAMTITCKHCHKSLKLEDIRFREYQARRAIETCGIVTIEKKGNVVSDRVQCGGLIVRGKLKGSILSRGPVLVGPEAEIKGDVTAPTLAVGAGAVLEGRYEIGTRHAPDSPQARQAAGAPASASPAGAVALSAPGEAPATSASSSDTVPPAPAARDLAAQQADSDESDDDLDRPPPILPGAT